MSARQIRFNQPTLLGSERVYLEQALDSDLLASGGPFSNRCECMLKELTGACRAILTHTCTDALELATLLLSIDPGDEVIVPSFSFPSTATAVALRGATPVFVDIDPSSLNLAPQAVEAAIGPATKAVMMVHYAGNGTGVDRVAAVCEQHGLPLVEDAAHGIGASYAGRPLGSFGQLSTYSFHVSKNLTCGEGGALLINDAALIDRAEMLSETGTDRARFGRGENLKYVWQDIGSSYRASEISAAILLGQLDQLETVTQRRRQHWQRYHEALADLEQQGRLRRPQYSAQSQDNAHIYYILLPDEQCRTRLINSLEQQGIQAVTHYEPLHDSPGGRRYGRATGSLPVTQSIARRILRLPMHFSLQSEEIDRVVESIDRILRT